MVSLLRVRNICEFSMKGAAHAIDVRMERCGSSSVHVRMYIILHFLYVHIYIYIRATGFEDTFRNHGYSMCDPKAFYCIFVKFGILGWVRNGYDITNPFVNRRFHILCCILIFSETCDEYDM